MPKPTGSTATLERPARKRAIRGQGSIYELSTGGWRGSAIVTDPTTGQRTRRYLSGPTADAVRIKMTELLGANDRGATVASPRLTTGVYLARWAAGLGSSVRPSTAEGYRGVVALYWVPLIGSIPLARLSPGDVEEAMGTLTARGLSARTVRSARAVLRRALSRAVVAGLVTRNAAGLAVAPRQPGWAIEFITIDQIRTLIEATADDPLGAAWTVGVTTGVRRGELLGLSWSDVRTGSLTVRRALARDAQGGWSLAEPKTARSRRTIPLALVAVRALERQRVRQDSARTAAGRAWQGGRDDLIFTDELGRPIAPDRLSHEWHQTSTRLGLNVPFRALRHSYATTLLTSGTPLVVISQTLGHSNLSITALHYSAVADELVSATSTAMDRALA